MDWDHALLNALAAHRPHGVTAVAKGLMDAGQPASTYVAAAGAAVVFAWVFGAWRSVAAAMLASVVATGAAEFAKNLIGMPTDVKGLAREYRRLTARRRLLVVLDDVDEAADIEPLLRVGPRCALLVTTARRRAGETGRTLELPPLDPADSMELLTTLVGPVRVDAAYTEAGEIVERCEGHPLAVQIVAGALARRANWQLDRILQADTRDDDGPGDLPGRRAMDLSFTLLTAQERRAAVVVGVLGQLTFEPWMLAAALSSPGAYRPGESVEVVPEEIAVHLAQRLVDARLVERLPDREGEFPVFRVEDYASQYAVLCRRRSFGPEQDAVAKSAIEAEADRRRAAAAATAVDARVNDLLERGRLGDALNLARERLETAELTGREPAAGRSGANADREHAHAALAIVYTELGDHDNAWYFSQRAGNVDDPIVQGRVLRCQGVLRYRQRDLERAEDLFERANAITRTSLDRPEQIRVLRELAALKALRGDPDGQRLAQEALDFAAPEDRLHRTSIWLLGQWAMGACLLAAARPDEAERHLEQAQAAAAAGDWRLWEAWIGEHRARAALARPADARAHAYRSAGLFGNMRHRYGIAHCRLVIAEAYLAERNPDDGIPVLEESLETFVNCGDRWIEARTMTVLAGALAAARPDRLKEAVRLFEGAARIFTDQEDTESAAAARLEANTLRERLPRVSATPRQRFLAQFTPNMGGSGT